ncbi:uncharacterized protein LOC120897694 [Anopheles arabiensis]|uniref:uncharacterized protein LOC120897694 n=1 Tax=Anopheles arabiensis TaxID=7173 RepID=UPI001AAD58BC|nr:uncharacterized protein LOC120897694 [Anopheles arabiensis]
MTFQSTTKQTALLLQNPPQIYIRTMPEPSSNDQSNTNLYMRLQQSQVVRANIQNISQFLNTGLSPETLDICVKLLEAGVHPQSLSEAVIQIRNEMAALNNGQSGE